MMTEILKAYDDVAVTAMKVSQLRGEANRISELTGYLDEKLKRIEKKVTF